MSEFDINASVEEPQVMDKFNNASIEEQQVIVFLIGVLKDEALRQKLIAALDAKDDAVIIQMASDRGFCFTQESLRPGIKNLISLFTPTALVEQ